MSGWRWDVLILAMGWLNGVTLGWLLWHRTPAARRRRPVDLDQLTERDPHMRIVE